MEWRCSYYSTTANPSAGSGLRREVATHPGYESSTVSDRPLASVARAGEGRADAPVLEQRHQSQAPSIIPVAADGDIAHARQLARQLADHVGFARGDQTVIEAVISEIGRNMLSFAGKGEITLRTETGVEPSIVVVARDQGPGIPDVSRALQEGFSTSGGLGLGLAGARRLMDTFEIVSTPGQGTTVTMKKWRRRHA